MSDYSNGSPASRLSNATPPSSIAGPAAPDAAPAPAKAPAEGPGPTASPSAPDSEGVPGSPIRLASLRISQDFTSTMGMKKILTSLAVRKPHRHEFVRVHPDEDHYACVWIFELKDQRDEQYLVSPAMVSELSGEVVPKVLYLAVNKQKVPFIWPVRLPGPDGKIDAWSASARDAVAHAKVGWVRVASDRDAGCYQVFEPQADLGEPEFLDIGFEAAVQIAFKDRYIDSPDHPAVRRIRGQL